jgi:hypothetical protein
MHACNGDSGGPLVVPVSGEYKLAGIVSWGSTKCDTYSGFTRVSEFVEWISSKTGIEDFRPAAPSGNNTICSLSDTTIYDVDPSPAATKYEWKLFPENAGTIITDSTNAKVKWNHSYSGRVQVMVRTTVYNRVSDWSKLNVMIVPKITLISGLNDIELCTNMPLSMGPSAEGYNLRYTWYRNNTLFQSGTSNIVSIKSLNSTNSGTYKYIISDVCGNAFSENFNLKVLPLTSITNLTDNIDVPLGRSPVLEVVAEGFNLTYQWQKDGIKISDANDSTLPLYDLNTKDIGLYRVSVNGTCGSAISDSIYVYTANEESSGTEVFVWPTITSGEFNIALNNEDAYTIHLYNTNGSIMKELKNCRYQSKIYVGNLLPGVYVMNVFNSSFRKTIKVIKN